MSWRTASRFIIVVAFSAIAAAHGATDDYKQGTITKNFSAAHKSYDVRSAEGSLYQINNCGDFQTGQVVDYRVKNDRLYVRGQNGAESKCAIEARSIATDEATKLAGEESAKLPRTYQKGTIEGYETRRDYFVGGGGGGGNGAPSNPVSMAARKAKVYELHGADLIYKVDYCGAFQAGKFAPGQVVEYRVEGQRLYIRHDNDKEYGCQIEGTRLPGDAKPADGNKPAPSSAPPSGL